MGFAVIGTRPLHHTDYIVRKEDDVTSFFVEILNKHVKISVSNLKLGQHWIYQMDNNLNHTENVVTQRLKDNKVNVLKWAHNILISVL